MAIVIVSLLVIVPLALLVWDTARNRHKHEDPAEAKSSSGNDRLRPHSS